MVLFMGMAKRSWPWIVVHIPRNFGTSRGFLNRIAVGSFGILAKSYSLTGSVELRSDCCSGLVLFTRVAEWIV
jgi:hypothetical protein